VLAFLAKTLKDGEAMNNCNECNAENYITGYLSCEEKTCMDDKGICFNCDFWTVKLRRRNPVVIDGGFYVPQSGNGPGMGGRRFDIKMPNGEEITTHNLSFCGDVPEHFRNRLPDNASFLNGAEKVQVGETTCFNGSRHHYTNGPLQKP